MATFLLWLAFTAASTAVFAGALFLLAPRQKSTGFIDWSQL